MFHRDTIERVRPASDLRSMQGDHASRYLWLAPQVSGLKVIDVGCGFGYGTAYLRETSAREVVGIDIDRDTIEFARRHYRREGLRYEPADISRDAPPARDFDVAVSFEVIEHLADPGPYLRYVRTALKPGGEFVLSTPNRRFTRRFYKDGRSRNPFHVREYDPDELAELLTRDFEILGTFVQSDRLGRLEKFSEVDELVDQSRIPSTVRHLIPRFMKNFYLRLRGRLPPDDRGRWADYPIEAVPDTRAIDDRVPVQLFRVRSRVVAAPAR